VRAFGAGESDIAAKLADLMRRDGNVLVGTTVGAGVVSVNVTAQAVHQDLADRIADETVNEICRRLGRWVYGTGDETLAGAVGGMLRRRHATLSVAESCTGGLLAQLVTDVSGASDYFVGGAICYSNRIKQDVVGVPAKVLQTHGAVSEQTAQAMARGARERFETTYALAITGIAGPAGGTETKPVGLVYTAIATPGQTRVQENYFHGDRTTIRMRSALTALNMLRQELTDTPDSQELAP